MTEVLLGLGSNVGDRLQHLRSGITGLQAVGRVTACSTVYESAPVGFEDQADFLNAAVRLTTGESPEELLVSIMDIESRAGRVRSFRDAPRTLDIDILFYGDQEMDGPRLTIPHPRWSERSFVLAPLMEIAVDWTDPRSGRTVGETWAERREGLPSVSPYAPLGCGEGAP